MIIVVLVVLGLCLGSFVNALVWRLHEQGRTKSKQRLAKLSISKGRSMCVHCGHELSVSDLIPVLSWLSLGGKCRYCQKPISWQYPVVELSTAALFVFSYIFWPSTLSSPPSVLFGLWLLILVGFVALLIYDLRWMILPDRIVFPLQGLAAIYVVTAFISGKENIHILIASVWGVVCSAGLFYVLFQVSRGRWIGGGDVKLAVVLGALVTGPAKALLMLFIASLLGSLVGIPLLLTGNAKRSSKLPFGPFLIIATFIVYLFGASLIAWYKRQFLLV